MLQSSIAPNGNHVKKWTDETVAEFLAREGEDTSALALDNTYIPETLEEAKRAASARRDTVEYEISRLMKKLRQQNDELQWMEDAIAGTRNELAALLDEYGEPWEDEDGYARVIPAHERVTFNTLALDTLFKTGKKAYAWLGEHRRVAQIKAHVRAQ